MASEDRNDRDDAPSEGSWVYISGPTQVPERQAAIALYDRLAEACVASGWHVYRPYAEVVDASGQDAPLGSRLRHALGHADACVFYVGKPSSGVGTELAWAAEEGRPVIAVHMRGEEPSPALSSVLNAYARARVLLCEDPDDCARKVRETLEDPQWHTVVRAAGAELADELLS